jgi:hypothetical protein
LGIIIFAVVDGQQESFGLIVGRTSNCCFVDILAEFVLETVAKVLFGIQQLVCCVEHTGTALISVGSEKCDIVLVAKNMLEELFGNAMWRKIIGGSMVVVLANEIRD